MSRSSLVNFFWPFCVVLCFIRSYGVGSEDVISLSADLRLWFWLTLTLLDGFRKITPIDRSSLARAESDQDHLEFSHPYFHRDHPELLTNIKRKQTLQKHPYLQTEPEVTKINTKELSSVFGELKQLRERQANICILFLYRTILI